MLAEDAKARRAELASKTVQVQSNMGDHFSVSKPEDKPVPYSHELFKTAAIEWLIQTNQVFFSSLLVILKVLRCFFKPIQAFEHPSFQKMMAIAARATQGLQFPSRKQTRNAIMKIFKDQMQALRDRLNVRSFFSNYTHCDI